MHVNSSSSSSSLMKQPTTHNNTQHTAHNTQSLKSVNFILYSTLLYSIVLCYSILSIQAPPIPDPRNPIDLPITIIAIAMTIYG